jgi:hypothetical protein
MISTSIEKSQTIGLKTAFEEDEKPFPCLSKGSVVELGTLQGRTSIMNERNFLSHCDWAANVSARAYRALTDCR